MKLLTFPEACSTTETTAERSPTDFVRRFPTDSIRRQDIDSIKGTIYTLIRSKRTRDIAFVARLLENLADGIKQGQMDGYCVTAAWEALPLDVSRLGASPGPRAS